MVILGLSSPVAGWPSQDRGGDANNPLLVLFTFDVHGHLTPKKLTIWPWLSHKEWGSYYSLPLNLSCVFPSSWYRLALSKRNIMQATYII